MLQHNLYFELYGCRLGFVASSLIGKEMRYLEVSHNKLCNRLGIYLDISTNLPVNWASPTLSNFCFYCNQEKQIVPFNSLMHLFRAVAVALQEHSGSIFRDKCWLTPGLLLWLLEIKIFPLHSFNQWSHLQLVSKEHFDEFRQLQYQSKINWKPTFGCYPMIWVIHLTVHCKLMNLY